VTSWWAGLAPAQASITCQGASHRLRFSEGALLALDHDDIEAERALAALGGDRCACVDLLDEWQRRSGDAQVLVAASRGPADPLAVDVDPPAPPRRRPGQVPVRGGWTAYAATASTSVRGAGGPPSPGEGDLGTLLALGGGLPDRLVATVVERLFASDPADVRLHAALYGRALSSVQGWLGDATRPLELDVIEGTAAAGVVEAADGDLRFALPVSWLGQVWARGLAVVAGRFCLSAESLDGCSFRLQVVAPDLSAPVSIVVELGPPG
jgi:hypothetical protein